MKEDFKAGFISVIGPPNVGKSTFVNRVVGHYISIISPKPQTTRFMIKGIKTTDKYQMVFIDTPGYLKPKNELQRFMLENIETALSDADVVLYMVDPFTAGRAEADKFVIEKFKEKPLVLAINKIDTIEKDKLLPIIDRYAKEGFKDVFPISVTRNYNISKLEDKLVELLPYGEPYFPDDMVSDYNERFFVAELIRETVFFRYGEEIPYAVHVEVEEFAEREKGKVYIRAIIYVERDSQKGIIIGKGGKALKRLGIEARKKIEFFLKREVYLELYVKVMEKWRKERSFVKRISPF